MSFQVIPRGKTWALRKGGAARAIAVKLTRAAAWREARRLARGSGSKAFLFGPDGRIVARNDYGAGR